MTNDTEKSDPVKTAIDDDEKLATWTLINDEIRNRVITQSESIKVVEAKAVLILALVAVAQFLNPGFQSWLAIPAVAAYAVAVGFSLAVIKPRQFADPPAPKPLIDHYIRERLFKTLGTLIATRAEAFEQNAEIHKWRVRYLEWGMSALIVAVILSGVDQLI